MQRHLGLLTIKGMIGSPYDRAMHKHGKDLSSPILMSCSSTLKLAAVVKGVDFEFNRVRARSARAAQQLAPEDPRELSHQY